MSSHRPKPEDDVSAIECKNVQFVISTRICFIDPHFASIVSRSSVSSSSPARRVIRCVYLQVGVVDMCVLGYFYYYHHHHHSCKGGVFLQFDCGGSAVVVTNDRNVGI